MGGYQGERQLLTADDETLTIIRALVRVAGQLVALWHQRPSGKDLATVRQREFILSNGLLSSALQEVGWGGGADRPAAVRIGKTLSRLRFRPGRDTDRRRTRGWRVSVDQILAVGRAYGIEPPPDPTPSPS